MHKIHRFHTEASAVLELILSLITSQNIYGLHQTLLQALERLAATKSAIGKVGRSVRAAEPVTGVATFPDVMRHATVT